MSNEMNDNDNDIEIENDIHQGNENQNQNQNLAEYFKVTPDDYTDSDSNTIIDLEEEAEVEKDETKEEKNENELQNNNSENENEGEENITEENKKTKNSKKKENLSSENQGGGEGGEGEKEQHENDEEQEDDQDNQDDNEEDENGITDPNVKKLMKMDLADKEGIIDLLMKDNLVKKSKVKMEKVIKKQNMAKFEHIEAKVGKSEIGNRKTTYGRKGFQIEQEEGNPEFIKDMNIAVSAVKELKFYLTKKSEKK